MKPSIIKVDIYSEGGKGTTEMRNMYDKIEWREPDEEDMKRIRRAIVKNKVESYILLGVLGIMLVAALVRIRALIDMFRNHPVNGILGAAIAIPFVIFIVRRIHLFSRYKIAEVTVEEIVLSTSSESSVAATATVSQGDITLSGINIFSKRYPEVGSKVLLFIENDDSWTAGII